jgi:8-oxo-dGTP pyrophosphatase MutT (NUDIX family)
MYKVFFNDRNVFLTDDFAGTFEAKYGLFYKLHDREDLMEILEFFRQLKKIDSLFIFHRDIEELQSVFRSCFLCIEAAGGFVKNKKGQILIMYRRGKWDLPKGKLEPGESVEQAALRETEEECGIKDLKLGRRMLSTYHTYLIDENPVLKKTQWFEILYSGNRKPVPQLKEDISEARWIDPSKLDFILKNTYGSIRDVLHYAGAVSDSI